SLFNPHSSYPSSRPHHHLCGTTVTIHRATTPMSNSVPVAGEQWPRARNRWPETVTSRLGCSPCLASPCLLCQHPVLAPSTLLGGTASKIPTIPQAAG